MLYQFKDALYKLFEETGAAVTVEPEPFIVNEGQYRPDMLLSLKRGRKEYKVVVEVKSIGQPRFIRIAAQLLNEYIASNKDFAYGILAAPYISEYGRQLCNTYGIGYVDLAGNCRIVINNIYIDIQGRENLYPTTRGLKQLFRKKSTRAIRVLLSDNKRFWYVRDLAKEADLSLGQVSNIKQILLSEDLIKKQGRSFKLTDPERLLNAWTESYSFRYNQSFDFYSIEGRKIEKKIASYCEDESIRYALALFSGANFIAPFVRYTKSFIYIQERIIDIAKQFDLKEVATGSNITLLKPYDPGVFYGTQYVGSFSIVSDIQLYIDLKKYRGRGDEAAQYILENRLRPKWK